jgi:hypothetical protein
MFIDSAAFNPPTTVHPVFGRGVARTVLALRRRQTRRRVLESILVAIK